MYYTVRHRESTKNAKDRTGESIQLITAMVNFIGLFRVDSYHLNLSLTTVSGYSQKCKRNNTVEIIVQVFIIHINSYQLLSKFTFLNRKRFDSL